MATIDFAKIEQFHTHLLVTQYRRARVKCRKGFTPPPPSQNISREECIGCKNQTNPPKNHKEGSNFLVVYILYLSLPPNKVKCTPLQHNYLFSAFKWIFSSSMSSSNNRMSSSFLAPKKNHTKKYYLLLSLFYIVDF